MVYAHNSEADFAGSELARIFVGQPELCYAESASPPSLSASATYEPASTGWPRADGVVSLLEAGANTRRDVALEYKRVQEGVHGLLTAIGQAQSYLHKGYNGAAIVIPTSYPTLADPATFVRSVLDTYANAPGIGVFHYDDPDTSSSMPFSGRLHCARPFDVLVNNVTARSASSGPKTQWVHMREGSTTRDNFFRFLQAAKRVSSGEPDPVPTIPPGLISAIDRLAPGKDAAKYLSNTSDDKMLSRIWRAFWFKYVVTEDVLTPWDFDGNTYTVHGSFTQIEREDGTGRSQIFEGRSSSLKETLISLLNLGAITEERAWEYMADGIPALPGQQGKQGVRARAHSYREDLDSSAAQLRWIEDDGRPTDLGFRFMTVCEKYGGANSHAARDYMGATLLQTGRYASFLHYLTRLSEKRFSSDPLAFTQVDAQGTPRFTEDSYWDYLEEIQTEMADDLKVLRKASTRNRPRPRTTFQAELTLLRNYGFVANTRYRLGVGVPVNWERVLEGLNASL